MAVRRKRAKDAEGHFVADNPATPDVNEAWVEDSPESPQGTLEEVAPPEPETVLATAEEASADVPEEPVFSPAAKPKEAKKPITEAVIAEKAKEVAEEANLKPSPGQMIGLRLLALRELNK